MIHKQNLCLYTKLAHYTPKFYKIAGCPKKVLPFENESNDSLLLYCLKFLDSTDLIIDLDLGCSSEWTNESP